MMPPIPQAFSVPVRMAADPRFVASLKRRKEIIIRLCAAAQDFLTMDIETELERAAWTPLPPPKPTLEDLARAQEQVETLESQLDAMNKLVDELPEAMAGYFETSQLPMLESYLKDAKLRVSNIQAAMEAPAPDPSNPWNGSHRIGTMCAICATDAGFIESSPMAIKSKLAAAGWGRDADGDHICPACFAATPKPSTQPAAPAAPSPATETSSQTQEGARP